MILDPRRAAATLNPWGENRQELERLIAQACRRLLQQGQLALPTTTANRPASPAAS